MESVDPSSKSQHSMSFLDLPLEIRMQIYRVLMYRDKLNPKHLDKMISVCQQIRHEALPILLKERQFRMFGLERFLMWANDGIPQHTKQVRHVSIMLHYKDCYVKIVQSPQLLRTPRPENLAESILNSPDLNSGSGIVSSLWSALCSLSNIETLYIETLYIDFIDRQDSFQRFQAEQQLLLDLVSFACPNILHLTVPSGLYSLSYLRRFSKLKTLCFSGYSTTSPEETLPILRSLKSLESLSIEQNHRTVPVESLIQPHSWIKNLSITPEVLSRMNPLKTYRVETVPFAQFRIEMLESLRVHSKSLENLEVECTAPGKELLLAILNFASTSPIPNFSLFFRLPESLTSIDFKSLFPPNAKAVDIFLWSSRCQEPRACLHVRAGKHFPYSRAIAMAKMICDDAP